MRRLRALLAGDAGPGLLLIAAAAAAMLVANGPLAEAYARLLQAPLGPLDLHHWINDGLMALFFLLVGLEVKRAFVEGDLATPAARRLPILAAAAGMAIPALVYLAVAAGHPGVARGWAIPAATDIAFALGVLALVGRGLPPSLRLFLTAVAVIDDVGAVAIIAFAYTPALAWTPLIVAAMLLGAMTVLARRGVRRLAPYLVLAGALWWAVLASGVHATVAGVLAALAIPTRPGAEDGPLERLEHALIRPVNVVVLPLFGFANAGVALGGVGPVDLLAPVPLGVALGLIVGKPMGIFWMTRLAVARGWAALPAGASWVQIVGLSLLAGVGFTMSLFIGALAFASPALQDLVKLGVLGGSLVSGLAGFAVLRATRRR